MTSRSLITVGLVWFAIVVVWLRFLDRGFAFGWVVGPSPAKQMAILVSGYVLIYTYVVFLIGWLIPLGFGIYRLVRHH